jgi:hypothetical protein
MARAGEWIKTQQSDLSIAAESRKRSNKTGARTSSCSPLIMARIV